MEQQYGMEYRQDNKKRYEYKCKNPQKHKLLMKLRSAEYYKKLRDAAFNRFEPYCYLCGYSDKRALQVDHINGGGNQEIHGMARHKYWIMIANLPEDVLKANYRVLCSNCNSIERWKHDEESRQQAEIELSL